MAAVAAAAAAAAEAAAAVDSSHFSELKAFCEKGFSGPVWTSSVQSCGGQRMLPFFRIPFKVYFGSSWWNHKVPA